MTPPQDLSAADHFCALAVLHYDVTDAPPRFAAATAMLRSDPALPGAHVWAAAAAADPAAVAAHCARDVAAASTRGGPMQWEPLLYLCYSRACESVTDALACATTLLDAGADPDAGFLWQGLTPPFTALTGVFGEGEQGPRRQPRHLAEPALAELLLRRGAHPVDQQTLYNRMFRPDNTHLELLFGHGLADAGPGPWETRLGDRMESREQMWRRQLDWAAEHRFADRLRLLARFGIDTSGAEMAPPAPPPDPFARDETGATALHHAAWKGDLPLMRRLLATGADPTVVESRFGGTPADWAEHAYQSEAAQLLTEWATQHPH
ncbi:ankyrin repeat domain-containing protein [Mycolicibacterium tokaiense]|nr:ankyrin repeat domain-containing protein [Mycolicibacterium tokaiense]